MKSNNFILSFALLLILFSGCKKDVDIDNSEIVGIPIEIEVTADIFGDIIADDDGPIQDVKVTVRNESTTSDLNGVFLFEDVKLDENGSLVIFEKEGFLDAFYIVYPVDGQRSIIKMKMIRKESPEKFQADIGGKVNIEGGGTLEFGPNTIVTASGQNYTGEVWVYARKIDATNNDDRDLIPGLRALDKDGELTQLATFVMANVQLESPSGEELNLAEASTAELRLPISSEITSVATSTIPLWYFDEDLGYWIEEGIATLDGNAYVGEVSHFSLWNCDAPFPVVDFRAQFVYENGKPASGKYVKILALNSLLCRKGFTNQEGILSGKIPQNESLRLLYFQEFDIQCGDFTMDFTSGMDPVDLGTIEVIPNVEIFHYEVYLTDCTDNPIKDGHLLVKGELGSSYYFGDSDGEVDITIPSCYSEVTLQAFSIDEELESPIIDFQNDPANSNEIDTIKLCDPLNLDFFIEFQIDGESTFYPGFDVFLGDGFVFDFEKLVVFWTEYDGNLPLVENQPYDAFYQVEFNTMTKSYECNSDESPKDCITLTLTDVNDDFIVGTFEGMVIDINDPNAVEVAVNGNFVAKVNY